jgi:uncharacterized protein YjiS (DUF1127 family)
MNRYTIPPHRLTRMQDAGLARSESLATEEVDRRKQTCNPGSPVLVVLRQFLGLLASEFAAAWTTARERRHTLKALKRVDRRLLRDLGIERGQLREVVDAMATRQAAEQRRDSSSEHQPCLVENNWMEARPAG